MTMETQNNKYDNNLMQPVIAIHKKEREVRRKGLQRENSGIKGGVFMKRMTAI